MSNELTIFEGQLAQHTGTFETMLAGCGIPAERVIRTIMFSVEKLPKLLECNRQSLINAAMSFACIQLECDGPTGQGYILPFAGKAQPVVGYKGYNTLAGRSGFSVNAAVVREGDHFHQRLGSRPEIDHQPILGNEDKIIGVYAVATSNSHPPIVAPALGINEILAVKAKAPGGSKSDSPWMDPAVGFPAMAQKTAIRRLWRYMPLNLGTVAEAMETLHERSGAITYVHPDRGVVVDQPEPERIEGPRLVIIKSDGSERVSSSIEQWEGGIALALRRIETHAQAIAFDERMTPVFRELDKAHPEAAKRAVDGIADLIDQMEYER